MNTLSSRLVTEPRRLRLFVSSTFTDMKEERRRLEEDVFPKIRRLCQERAVEFYAVNLVWGISSEVRLGDAIDICLREVRNCHPFFLGFIGQRYGRVHEKTAEKINDLLNKQPDLEWLRGHLPASVTELEIQQLLRLEVQKEKTQFYCREAAYLETLRESERFQEKDGQREDLFAETGPLAREKLRQLKQQLVDAQLPLHSYATPQQGAQFALERLTAVVEEFFPAASVPDELARQRGFHNAFAASRRDLYLRSEEDMARLTEFVAAANTQGLVITGESGVGKTALLANWAVDYEKAHPEQFIFWHFIGSSADSAAVTELLRRLYGELKAQFPLVFAQREVPAEAEEVIKTLPDWLASVPERIVVMIDGLNQLLEADQRLAWLPELVPAQVRLMVSTVAGTALDSLQRRGWPRFNVALFDEAKRQKFVEKHLKNLGKALKSDQVEWIVKAKPAANPLYLKVLLHELVIEGRHHTLDAQIQAYLQASDLTALYDQVLARFERIYSSEVMRQIGSALWATRWGLAEEELLALAGVSKLDWATLSAGLEDVMTLVNRGGLLGFYHQYVQQAVAQRYVETIELQQAAHRRLAEYFAQQTLDKRVTNLLPYHWFMAGDKEALKACISQAELFNLHVDKYELMSYWRAVADYAEMEAVYKQPEILKEISKKWKLANLLEKSARYEYATVLCKQLLEETTAQFGPDHPSVAQSLNNLAALYYAQSQYDQALPLYQRSLAIDEKVLGPDHPDVAQSLNNLAALYDAQSQYDQALPLYQRSLAIREKVLGPDHPDVANSLNNLAVLYHAQGQYDQALPLSQRSLAIGEKVLGPDHPEVASSLNNLAGLYYAQGQYDQALPLSQRSLAIYEKVLGPNHPDVATNLNNLAELYRVQGQYDQALPLYQRSLAIQEKVLGPDHPDVASSLNNLATLYDAQGQYDQALPLSQRSLAIREKVLGPDHPEVASSLNNLAALYYAQGQYDQALPLYQRSLAIREKVLGPDHPHVATSLNNLALLYDAQGQYDQALPLYQRSLAIYEKVLGPDHPDVAHSLNNLAYLYQAQGQYDQAKPLYERAVAIAEKKLGVNHPNTKLCRENYEENQRKLISRESSVPWPLLRRSWELIIPIRKFLEKIMRRINEN